MQLATVCGYYVLRVKENIGPVLWYYYILVQCYLCVYIYLIMNYQMKQNNQGVEWSLSQLRRLKYP